jgi:hypothetical protein
MTPIRIDLIFSNWILLWFILYIFKFTTYSPKFILLVGILENIIMEIILIIHKKFKTFILFLIIITLTKIIPFYYIRNSLLRKKDVYFTVALFIVYLIWLHMNNRNFINIIIHIYDSLIHDKNLTPFMAFFAELQKKYITIISI